jgi:hypothetical protein
MSAEARPPSSNPAHHPAGMPPVSRQQIEPRVETNAQTVDDRVVLHRQLRSMWGDYAGFAGIRRSTITTSRQTPSSLPCFS